MLLLSLLYGYLFGICISYLLCYSLCTYMLLVMFYVFIKLYYIRNETLLHDGICKIGKCICQNYFIGWCTLTAKLVLTYKKLNPTLCSVLMDFLQLNYHKYYIILLYLCSYSVIFPCSTIEKLKNLLKIILNEVYLQPDQIYNTFTDTSYYIIEHFGYLFHIQHIIIFIILAVRIRIISTLTSISKLSSSFYSKCFHTYGFTIKKWYKVNF